MELNGQPLQFPVHEIPKPVNYSLEVLCGGIYKEVIAAIEGLNFAVYNLEAYGVQTETEDTVARLNHTEASQRLRVGFGGSLPDDVVEMG